MADFKQQIDDALDILKFDGAVQDTLAELREKWSAQVPVLLEERFDAVGVQYMKLPHEKGVDALGQELSAFGWALYNLDAEDEYLFILIPEEERSELEHFCKKHGQYCRLMKQPGRKWGAHAKEQDPGALMPCEEYILETEHDYFFNSLAGDFAAGGMEIWLCGRSALPSAESDPLHECMPFRVHFLFESNRAVCRFKGLRKWSDWKGIAMQKPQYSKLF